MQADVSRTTAVFYEANMMPGLFSKDNLQDSGEQRLTPLLPSLLSCPVPPGKPRGGSLWKQGELQPHECRGRFPSEFTGVHD